MYGTVNQFTHLHLFFFKQILDLRPATPLTNASCSLRFVGHMRTLHQKYCRRRNMMENVLTCGACKTLLSYLVLRPSPRHAHISVRKKRSGYEITYIHDGIT